MARFTRAACGLMLLSLVSESWAQTAPPQTVPPQTAPGQTAPAPSAPIAAPATDRDVSWLTLPKNVLKDQKRIWLFPASLAKGHNLVPFLLATAATAGFIRLDPSVAPYFRRTTTFKSFNSVFSGNNMVLATILVPVSFYAVGLVRHDSYAQKTALLAGEAVVDVEILDFIMKGISRRIRPSGIPPNGNYSKTFFRDHSSFLQDRSSFPSGHAIAAFAIATVFAHRYRTHRWVPWLSYGAAGLIAFSRLTTSAHFPTDVFVGGILGYSVAQFAVLRP